MERPKNWYHKYLFSAQSCDIREASDESHLPRARHYSSVALHEQRKSQLSPLLLATHGHHQGDQALGSPCLSRGSVLSWIFHFVVVTCSHSSSFLYIVTGQLLWREMSHLIGYSTPNFGQMVGNPVCRQIPWRDPSKDKEAKIMLDR